ncbi:MAG: hypothetical protein A2Y14_01305 [Verrucomicrobia bacterium GWF2_51_19]|nr:MAG: hypothetical protein A2Y14_01305 [Verrucomicrobia bacterium GWF2_51_19]HCJ11713.1 chromosome partitioning protein ParB [Opitutae bacterium]
MKKQCLGRGLSALIESSTSVATSEEKAADSSLPHHKEDYRWIATHQIVANPYQPRKQFDSASLQELANSIRQEGLIQPIVVRPKGAGFELIAGERRLRAFEILGEKEILAHVIEAADKKSATIALVENLQREDLNPLDEALSLSSLLHDFDLTQEEVAKHVGKARSTITNALRLLTLPTEIQKLIRQQKLTTGHAKAILSLAEPDLQSRVATRIAQRGLSVRETETIVKRLLSPSKKSASSPKQREAMRSLEKKIADAIQTAVKIHKNLDQGTIAIQYKNSTELQRVLEKLLR